MDGKLTIEQVEEWRRRPNHALNNMLPISDFSALCNLAIAQLRERQAASREGEGPVAVYAGVDMNRYTIEWLIEPDTTGMKPLEKLRALAYKERIPVGTKLYAAPQPAASREGEPVREFVRTIPHGDAQHQAWLLYAAECFIAGQPLPAPAQPDLRAGLLAAAEICEQLFLTGVPSADGPHGIRGADADDCAVAIRAKANEAVGENKNG